MYLRTRPILKTKHPSQVCLNKLQRDAHSTPCENRNGVAHEKTKNLIRQDHLTRLELAICIKFTFHWVWVSRACGTVLCAEAVSATESLFSRLVMKLIETMSKLASNGVREKENREEEEMKRPLSVREWTSLEVEIPTNRRVCGWSLQITYRCRGRAKGVDNPINLRLDYVFSQI